jgi:hypothetical protein
MAAPAASVHRFLSRCMLRQIAELMIRSCRPASTLVCLPRARWSTSRQVSAETQSGLPGWASPSVRWTRCSCRRSLSASLKSFSSTCNGKALRPMCVCVCNLTSSWARPGCPRVEAPGIGQFQLSVLGFSLQLFLSVPASGTPHVSTSTYVEVQPALADAAQRLPPRFPPGNSKTCTHR